MANNVFYAAFIMNLHFQTKKSQSNWRRRLMNGNYVCMTLGRCRKTIVDAISNSTCPEKMRHLRFLFISVQISTSRRLNERQISLNKESANRSNELLATTKNTSMCQLVPLNSHRSVSRSRLLLVFVQPLHDLHSNHTPRTADGDSRRIETVYSMHDRL